jgi:hypothetical protein
MIGQNSSTFEGHCKQDQGFTASSLDVGLMFERAPDSDYFHAIFNSCGMKAVVNGRV